MTLLRSLLALSIGAASLSAAEQAPAILPFEPAQLLTALPSAPAEWKVLRSEADNALGDWVETRATRAFSSPPQPPVTPDAPSGPAGEVEISVTDTAGFAPSLAAFTNFTPGKSGTLERKLIGSLPAIVTSGEDGRALTQVLVSNRYIVEVSIARLPQSKVEDWLRGFHFDLLPPGATTPVDRPNEFRLTHIDELHPENNRSYFVSTTSSKRVHEHLKRSAKAEKTASTQ
jgi:hypothetical protein